MKIMVSVTGGEICLLIKRNIFNAGKSYDKMTSTFSYSLLQICNVKCVYGGHEILRLYTHVSYP